jgi:hypothetical protein
VKFFVDCFLDFDLFCYQLFFLLLDLRSLLFEICLELVLLLLHKSALLYHFLLCLLQGHCVLLFFFLCVMKASFDRIIYSAELGRLISQLCFFLWRGHSGHYTARVKGLLYPSHLYFNPFIHGLLLGFIFLQNFFRGI